MRVFPAGLRMNIAIATAAVKANTMARVKSTKINIKSSSCSSHSDCQTNHFCALSCFTGSCGNDGSMPANGVGLFCQPCNQCINWRSITTSCDVCPSDTAVRTQGP